MITYRIDASAPHTHCFAVELTITKPWPNQRLSLPVWIPGSYLVREFGRHLSGLSATQGGKAIALKQLDKTTWEAQGLGKGALTVRYQVYAFDTSVRTAFLNTERGFFNTGFCVQPAPCRATCNCRRCNASNAGSLLANLCTTRT